MARTLNASLQEEIFKKEDGSLINLYQVQVSASPIQYEYWASYNEDVDYFIPETATPQTYTPAAIVSGTIEISDGSKIPSITLGIGSVDQLITAYIENHDALRGFRVKKVYVPLNKITNASANIVDTFYIDGCSIDIGKETAVFELTSKGADSRITVPIRQMRRDQCSWLYKGTECKSTSSDPKCEHTRDDCKNNKNNLINFGAFPGISTKRISYR